MKILLVYHHPLSDPSFSKRWLPLIKGLETDSYRFDIICTDKDIDIQNQNIDVILEKNDRSLISYLIKTAHIAANERYDRIHAVKPGTSLPAYIGSAIGKNRFILDVDDYDWKDNLFYRASAKFLLDRVDGLITASKRLNQRFGGTYLPNSAHLDSFNPYNHEQKAERLRQKHGLGGQRVLFWAGKFVPEVNTEFLIKIGENLDESILLVAGDGPTFEDFNEEAASVEGLLTLGWVEGRNIPAFYALSDAGLIPFPDTEYHRSKCPIKLFEYMASGLPIMSTRVGEPKLVIREAECGIVASSPRTLAKNFECSSNQELNQLGKNGRKYLEDNQTYEILRKKLKSVYKEAG